MGKKNLYIAFIVCIILFLYISISFSMGTGSSAYAKKWAKKFKYLHSIEEAKNSYPQLFIYKFSTQKWIIGICDDSHSSRLGGTIVIRDSEGNIYCFFGHVCGPGYLKNIKILQLKNMKEVLNFLTKNGFEEHNPAEEKNGEDDWQK